MADNILHVPSRYAMYNLLFAWSINEHHASERRKLYSILFGAKTFNECVTTLNLVSGKDLKALALNDTPEAYRIQAFKQLRTRRPHDYDELVGKISYLQRVAHEKHLEPTFLYHRVATKSFMATLPCEAQQCFDCKTALEEFSDMIWRPCRKHVQCTECWRRIVKLSPDSPYNPWGCDCGPRLIYG
ncbi:hypothetical protein F5883DRAFT_583399 [Diaporthe sp. PMI_573]|nr:hypothetical protein F5883DRAFT_584562 [Diaporthaceae sp. PMI_573]KAH8747733.1 hypothetical protein F5883DRAFT_583399 [Diaporthaceae sp. PMI_573]